MEIWEATQIKLNKKILWNLVKLTLIFNLLILFITSTSFVQRVNAEEIGYYHYDSRLSAWVWISKPWRATATTTLITINVKGLPSEYPTELIIDGKPVGVIQGGESKHFEVDKKSSHTIQVNKEVKSALNNYGGIAVGTRYVCPGNIWNIELTFREVTELVPVWYRVLIRNDSSYYWDYYVTYEYRNRLISDLAEKAHVFEYFVEHEVYVIDPYGLKSTGWFKDGESIILSAKNFVVTKDEPNVKERAIFKNWIVNGAPIENNIVPLKIDKPIVALAEYDLETKYKVNVYSEFGHISLNKLDGWYLKGEEATVSIEPEIPMNGWEGLLGGKMIFNGWYTEKGLESKNAAFNFIVNEPKNLKAEWRIDESKPIIAISILVALIIAALCFAFYKRSSLISKLKRVKPENDEVAKLKAEVERLKKIIETQIGKPVE
jgi:hypothetical protein